MASYDYKTKGTTFNSDDAISIKTDISDCLKFFDGLDVNRVQIKRRLMKVTGRGAVLAAKRGVGNTLHNRTGTLKKGMTYTMGWQGEYVKIYSKADSGKATAGLRRSQRFLKYGITHEHRRTARYGFMLAYGYTATATSSWGMRFQVNGKWVTKHQIRVEGKDWLAPSVIRYADSNDLHNRLQKEFQNQINYWEKRITGGNLK